MTLPPEYLTELEHRARRFSGAYTGTSGTLAAGVIHLINERATMTATIDTLTAANAALRDAVETRLAGGSDAKEGWKELAQESAEKYAAEREQRIPADWILQGQRELEAGRTPETAPQDGLRPGSREFLGVLEECKTLHLKKTLDYGVDEDALSNIRSSADIVGMEPWAGCILRIMDKMHRIKAYFRRGKCEFDGIEDTLKDVICYAAIALVFHRQSKRP
jgi:hypothetical protein